MPAAHGPGLRRPGGGNGKPGGRRKLSGPGAPVLGLETALRRRERPIIGRISQGQYLLDVRTLWDEDFADIETAVKEVLQ